MLQLHGLLAAWRRARLTWGHPQRMPRCTQARSLMMLSQHCVEQRF